MAEPFKLRHVNSIVGVFVLAALALGLLGVAAAARTKQWFEQSVDVEARFPAAAAESLALGTPVTLAQDRVGEVSELSMGEGDDGLRVRLHVWASARERLRADARAVFHLPLGGLLGQPGIELRRGLSPLPFPAGGILPGAGGSEMTRDLEQVAQHVDALVVKLGPTVDHVNALLAQLEQGDAGTHAADLLREASALARSARERRILADASAAVADVHAILAGLRSGQGSAGKLLADDELHRRLSAAVEKADAALTSVTQLSGSAGEVTKDLAVITSRARARADDLELLLARTETLVLRANQTIDMLNRHWLLGGSTAAEDALPVPPAVLDREPAPKVAP
jgi:ABC-type transporter Mla subunit MlaD